MKTARAAWIAVASALLALSACSKASQPATSPQSVQTKAASYGSTIAKNATGALNALNGMSSMTALSNGLAPLQNAFGGNVPVLSTVGSSTSTFLASRRSVRSFARLQSTSSMAPADQLSQYLSERVFTAANIESSDGTSVTYLLNGNAICPYILPDGTTSLLASSGATLDPGCVSDVEKLQLRIKAVEPAADALNLTLEIGPNKAAPLTMELRTGSVALVVSLDGVKGSLEFLHTTDSTVPVPLTMAGAVDLKITFNREISGNVDVTFSSSVRQAVDLKVQDASGTSEITTAAKDPWAALQVDGIDKKVVALLDLGKTTVNAPYQTLSGPSKQETTTLGGLSFAFSAQDGQAGAFTISNIGLGNEETNVFLDTDKTSAINLDPRQFALSFKPDAANPNLTIFTIDPSFELASFVNNVPYGNTDPATAGMTYTWTLTATTGKPAIEPYSYSRGAPYYGYATALKVVSGTLTLTDGILTVTVPQGKCLLDAVLTSAPTSKVQEYVPGDCPPL